MIVSFLIPPTSSPTLILADLMDVYWHFVRFNFISVMTNVFLCNYLTLVYLLGEVSVQILCWTFLDCLFSYDSFKSYILHIYLVCKPFIKYVSEIFSLNLCYSFPFWLWCIFQIRNSSYDEYSIWFIIFHLQILLLVLYLRNLCLIKVT